MNAGYIYDNNQFLFDEGVDLKKIKQFTKDLIDKVNKINFCHGFEGVELSAFDLRGLSLEEIGNVTFDQKTKWPSIDKLPKGFVPELLLKSRKGCFVGLSQLRDAGITGKGVNVAYIDQQNKYVFKHEEFKKLNYEYLDFNGDDLDCFHPYGVLSNLCGQNTGVAPDINLLYYSAYKWKHQDESMLNCLKDILNKLQNNVPVDVVGISGPLYLIKDEKTEQQKQIDVVVEQISSLGCEVIDGFRFLDEFTCCGLDASLNCSFENVDFPSWASSEDRQKPAFICKGQVIAEWQTTDEYVYQGVNCDSWPTAQCVGLFALCRQIEKNITYQKFVSIVKNSCLNSGVVDFQMCIENIKLKSHENDIIQ